MELSTAVPHAQGATGRVLRARDERSGREVAIKVLRGDDPLWARRMARESAALGKLRHPHICPILDVTEYDGQPAIILPFIDGEPIDRALADQPIDRKLAVMRDVIAAVHAAHHDGIIHRDLKPGNVLVERRGDGFHAWVLDFGLARSVTDETLTAAGQVLGTPGYLAPEQARGEAADVRSDIYALGVMLFEVLTGRRPHEGETSAELLLATMTRDAASVRSLDPRIPVPVARVVAKCLERRPRLRYASARELLDDMEAIARGRPVSARGIGPLYRFRRRVSGSPVLSGAIAVALVAILAASWIGLRGAAKQRQVASQSRALEQQVATVEQELRLVHLKPVHDIRPDVRRITDRALAQALSIARLNTGPVAAAAQAAVGRLYMAVGDHRAAIEPLERAYYAGLREPIVIGHLAEAYAAVYFDALADARRKPDARVFEEARERAEQAYGIPARRFLGELEGGGPVAAALLAHLDGDQDGALARLASVPDGVWPVPAWLLDIRLRLDAASQLLHEGLTVEATVELDAIAERVDRVTDMVRSHPEARRLACRSDALEIALAMTGVSGRDLSLGHCVLLRRLDPDRLSHRLAGAAAYANLARYTQLVAGDPGDAVRAGLAWLGEDPDGNPAVEGLRGALLFVQAIHRQQVQGRIASDLLGDAAAALEAALAADPDNPEYVSDLASVLEALGSSLYLQGEDGDPAFARAIDSLSAAADRNPHYLSVNRELISLLMWRGYERYIRGREAREILDEAVARAAEAAARWPESAALHATRGMAARTLAEYQLQIGEDPTTASRLALDAFDRSLAIQPDSFSARFNRCGVPILMVQHRLRNDRDPGPWLERLDEQLAGLLEVVSDADEVAVQVGIGHALRARAELAAGRWPDTELALARERLGVALKSEWDRPQALLTITELARDQHRAALARGKLDRSTLRSDLAIASEGLAEAPDLHLLRIHRADLLEMAVDQGLRHDLATSDPAAERARALTGNPQLAHLVER